MRNQLELDARGGQSCTSSDPCRMTPDGWISTAVYASLTALGGTGLRRGAATSNQKDAEVLLRAEKPANRLMRLRVLERLISHLCHPLALRRP